MKYNFDAIKGLSLEKQAAEIAEIANECCYRSDGYEEAIRDLVLEALKAAWFAGKNT